MSQSNPPAKVTVSNPTTNPETGLAKDATLTGGTQKTKLVDTGGVNVAVVTAAGAVSTDNVELPAPAALAEATVNPTTTFVGSGNHLFNSTTWDRQRGNYAENTILASAAKTASGQTNTFTNYNSRGIILFIVISAVSGTTPTITFQVQAQDPVTSAWSPIHAATTAVTAAGTSIISLYPGATTAPPGTGSLAVSLPLPRTWRVGYTIGGTTPSFTFSIGGTYIV